MKNRQEMILQNGNGDQVELTIQRDLIGIREHYHRLLSTVINFQTFSEIKLMLPASTLKSEIFNVESRELNDDMIFLHLFHTSIDPSYVDSTLYCQWVYINIHGERFSTPGWSNFDELIEIDQLLTDNNL